MPKKRGVKAQVALWAIIAIIIVVVGILSYFFIFKVKLKYPERIQKIEESYVSCLSDIASIGKEILMAKGGRIYDLPDEPKGLYFSNNLNFMGEKIAYWSYYDASGNYKEQIPTLKSIENELERFIKENIGYCDDILENQNITYEKKLRDVRVNIGENEIHVIIFADLNINVKGESYLIKSHEFSVKSNLKKLYNNAKKIFEYEKNSRFLENYTYDIVSLYAKTSGFEIQCMPLVFSKDKLKQDIVDGLNVNIERIKFKGNYFKIKNQDSKYYINDVNIDDEISVNLLYLPLFPTEINIYGGEDYGNKISFDPIGNQPGLNLVGFCYVPYHLVYDVKYPVLITLASGNEIFKFPIAIVIERNAAKQVIEENQTLTLNPICQTLNTEAKIFVYDDEDRPINANIYFKCLDTICYIGEAKEGYLSAKVPQCVNGFLIANANGYAEKKLRIDSIDKFISTFFLNRIYEKKVELGLNSDENALIFFNGETSYALNYPDQKSINISAGYYNVSVYVFKEKNIEFNGKSEVCWDVPVIAGITRKQCSEIEGGSFDRVIVGGGKARVYIDKDELKKASKVEISFERFDIPKSLEDIEKNFELIELNEVNVRLI